MGQVIEMCINKFQLYFGDDIYLSLYIASLIVLILLENDKKIKQLILGQALLFNFIYWCPLTAYIIAEFCIGEDVYWRMFWLLPTTITIAFALVKIFQVKRAVWERILIVVLLSFILLREGTPIYNETFFYEEENWLKIDQDVVEICELIKNDAKEVGIKNRGVIVPNEFICQIKQYDGIVRMPYGRDMLRGKGRTRIAGGIYDAMNAETLNAELLFNLAKEGNYQYLVYASWVGTTAFEQAGFRLVNYIGEYSVYCIEK